MLKVNFILLALMAASYRTSFADLAQEITETACLLQNNATLLSKFQLSVRQEYNSTKSSTRYAQIVLNSLNSVRGYAKCDGATISNVTWCVHLYHPTQEIRLCLNESGVVSQTASAAAMKLESLFHLREDCDNFNSPYGCLWTINTQYFLNGAYLVCSLETTTCSNRAFVQLIVDVATGTIEITELPASPTSISLGESAVLTCSATITAALGYVQWSHNGTSYYNIHENPYCIPSANVTCSKDTSPAAPDARRQRVRAYSVQTTYSLCGAAQVNMVTYLMIDNVIEVDSGAYNCTAGFILRPQVEIGSVEVVTVQSNINATAVPTAPSTEVSNSTKETFVVSSVAVYQGHYAIYIAVPLSMLCLILLLVSVVLAMLYLKKKRINKRIQAKNILIYEKELDTFPHHTVLHKDIPVQTLPLDLWEFPRERLQILGNRLLGKGAFGKVFEAKAVGIIPDTPERNVVAVKMVKDNAPPQEILDLYDEMEIMKKMDPHENLLNLLGYCTTPGGPLYLIIEFAIHGSLRSFLNSCEEAVLKLNHQPIITRKRSRSGSSSTSSISSTQHLLCGHTPPNNPTSSTPHSEAKGHFVSSLQPHDSGYCSSSDLLPDNCMVAQAKTEAKSLPHTIAPVSTDYINCRGLIHMEDVQNFALQIASGLKHLEAMDVVHCDLAARNILIAEGFVLKISDFGMARDISGKEYYRKSPKGRVPVKWTAPEALEEHLYTFKSDIWSFGVVLWEIFTYGHSPYPDVEILAWEPFIQFLKDGNRPSFPCGCPENIYQIMQGCWQLDPLQRLSASDLVQAFLPKCDEEGGEPFTPTIHDGCHHHLEVVQEDPERYIV